MNEQLKAHVRITRNNLDEVIRNHEAQRHLKEDEKKVVMWLPQLKDIADVLTRVLEEDEPSP